jgi:hypothetical protein
MSKETYRYHFEPQIDIDEVEQSLLLAILSVEALHGETQTRLDAAHAFDAERRSCVIDAGTDVGRSLNRLFLGYVRREFGEDAFSVSRVETAAPAPQLATSA